MFHMSPAGDAVERLNFEAFFLPRCIDTRQEVNYQKVTDGREPATIVKDVEA